MRSAPPTAILFARRVALTEAVVAAVIAGLGSAYALRSQIDDDRAARAGNPAEFAGLGETLGLWLAGLALAYALLMGVPALMLRGRTAYAGWWACIAAQALMSAFEIDRVGAAGSAAAVSLGLGSTALNLPVLLALLRPTARTWASARTRRPDLAGPASGKR